MRRQAVSSIDNSGITDAVSSAVGSLTSALVTATDGSVSSVITSAVSSLASAASIASSAASSASSASESASSASSVPSATVYTVVVETGTATYPTDGSLITTTYQYTSSVTDPRVFASLLLGNATSTSVQPSTSTGTSHSGGLSTGAKAGIGVGSALGAIAIVSVVGALVYTRRKKPSQAEPATISQPETTHGSNAKAELQNQSLTGGRYYQRNELHDPKQTHEMGARERAMAAELEAEYYSEMGSKSLAGETSTTRSSHP